MTTATARSMERSEGNESCGGRLVATDGRALPLKETRLKADAKGGVARVVLEQRFANPYAEPLCVTYLLPLPADGAVSGFSFTIGQRRIRGEVDRKERARARYEQALVEGRSAAIVEQDRSSLFTQEIGNIPPRTEVVAEIVVDQRLAWLTEGAWELRFPTAVAPRYQGESGRVEDAAKLDVSIAEGPVGARMFVDLVLRDAALDAGRPESPSHAMRFVAEGGRLLAMLEAEKGAPLDRDLVVRWPAAQPQVGLSLSTGRAPQGKANAEAAFGLLTVVPPRPERQVQFVPRDLIVLLDTSGSMGGEPLAQAKRIVAALVDSLDARDRLEMIEFSTSAHRFKWRAAEASPKLKKKALAWLDGLEAGGGTEMREGIFEALEPLRADAQRQVVLVTDGLIGFESEVVAAILGRLPAGSRLHTVGVGSAVNRSLTGPAARAGRGLEIVVGLGEDPERAARRLLARTERPLVTDLVLEGTALLEHAPLRLPDLFAGAPVLVGVKLRAEGGTLAVRGHGAQGTFSERLEVGPVDFASGTGAAAALFAREQVEDLEMQVAAGEPKGEMDVRIERIGLGFQIATRRTSWVAISDLVDVDPRSPSRREDMPHELAFGLSAEGLGLRSASVPAPAAAAAPAMAQAVLESAADLEELVSAPRMAKAAAAPARMRRSLGGLFESKKKEAATERAEAGGAPPSPTRQAPAEPPRFEADEGVSEPEPMMDEAAPAEEFEAEAGGFAAEEKQVADPERLKGSKQVEAKPEPAKPESNAAVADQAADRPKAPSAQRPAAPPAARSAPPARRPAAPGAPAAGAPPPPAAAAPRPRGATGKTAGALALSARVALVRGRELVLELTVDARGLAWDPERLVVVTFDDGTVLQGTIELERSTAPQSLTAGQVVRVVIRLEAEAPESRPLRAALTSQGSAIIAELA
ncbi:MAG TPA: VIT domain-containing protein [Myxococcales bacterium]|jgi:Ca-activated chloride channel family protein